MWIKKWERRVKYDDSLSEKIITLKLQHESGYITITGVYALEEGKEEKTTLFYQTLQNIIDKYNKLSLIHI